MSSVRNGQLELSAVRNGWIANTLFDPNMLDPKTNLKFYSIQIRLLKDALSTEEVI
jgi:hypothetical protein